MIRWYGKKIDGSGILRNISDGGDGSSVGSKTRRNYSHSEDTKRKISNALQGKQLSKSHKESLSKNHKGRLGKTNSPEHCAKISAALVGRVMTEEHKNKLKKAQQLRRLREHNQPNV
jgi:hypothetical protein